jgi:RNA recognition motif-containing protein
MAGMMMPPPSQPALGLSIPSNNQPPIPQHATIDELGNMMSPGGTISRAAPEPNKRALYVGGLDPRVTEDVLKQIFETTGHVQNVKIIPDKNVSKIRFVINIVRRCKRCQRTRYAWRHPDISCRCGSMLHCGLT